jgi:hypothetical protein
MIDRRVFLKNGSLAMVSLGFAPAFVARAAEAAQSQKKVLVAIFQRGAVDGLNMVVPFGERAYYANRPSIAIARPGSPDGAIDLDGFFWIAPAPGAAGASLQPPGNGDRARLGFTRRDAFAFRRAGLHGKRHARDEKYA